MSYQSTVLLAGVMLLALPNSHIRHSFPAGDECCGVRGDEVRVLWKWRNGQGYCGVWGMV